LWKLHDSKHAHLSLAAEQYMVDRGASSTFVRWIELMKPASIKIIAPFRVMGAGGTMFARLADRLELYLEDGKMRGMKTRGEAVDKLKAAVAFSETQFQLYISRS
jgi:hypothetical protein